MSTTTGLQQGVTENAIRLTGSTVYGWSKMLSTEISGFDKQPVLSRFVLEGQSVTPVTSLPGVWSVFCSLILPLGGAYILYGLLYGW